MKLRTSLPPSPSSLKIDHKSSLYFVGSCFAENIGKRMIEHKFDCLINPLGIAYNPVSVFKHLLLSEEDLDWNNIKQNEDVYFMYDFHSSFNQTSKEKLKEVVLNAIQTKNAQLDKSNLIFISLGTAYTYYFNENNAIVTNCQKQDPILFTKKLLSVIEIKEMMMASMKTLNNTFGKEFDYVFTISPIRHLKDGIRENQLSKSTLHLALQECMNLSRKIYYFPAYELVIDDLRDYRFYEKDLLHPNELAIEYIWDYFSQTYFSADTIQLNKVLTKTLKALNHKPYQGTSTAHLRFLNGLEKKLMELANQHELDFSTELKEIKAQLK